MPFIFAHHTSHPDHQIDSNHTLGSFSFFTKKYPNWEKCKLCLTGKGIGEPELRAVGRTCDKLGNHRFECVTKKLTELYKKHDEARQECHDKDGCKQYGMPNWQTCKSCIAKQPGEISKQNMNKFFEDVNRNCEKFWGRPRGWCMRAKLRLFFDRDGKAVSDKCRESPDCKNYAWNNTKVKPQDLLQYLFSQKKLFEQCATALKKEAVVKDAEFQQKTWDSCFGDAACLKKEIKSKLEPGIMQWNLKNKTAASKNPGCVKFLASSAPVDSTHSIWLYDVRSTRNANLSNFL
jgi:hypothetical protein